MPIYTFGTREMARQVRRARAVLAEDHGSSPSTYMEAAYHP